VKSSGTIIAVASPSDAEAIVTLQRLAFRHEAETYANFSIAPLIETVADVQLAMATSLVLRATWNGKLAGAVRGSLAGKSCKVSRLMVHPDMQRLGVGTSLMSALEAEFPQAETFDLFTGHLSAGNLRLYERLGYIETRRERVDPRLTFVHMQKARHVQPLRTKVE
jgi:ribosomal protein S18 acetylase RimI-like enzyme